MILTTTWAIVVDLDRKGDYRGAYDKRTSRHCFLSLLSNKGDSVLGSNLVTHIGSRCMVLI